jgi:hypothetical protein
MNITMLCLLLLVLAVLLGSGRYLFSVWRNEKLRRPKAWRVLAIVFLQIGSALFLYLVLFPPPTFTSAERLVILTANANLSSKNISGRLLALPEAPDTSSAERVPDLATALRRYPGALNLQIIGDGLSARDQEAAHGLSVKFSPSPLRRGLIELTLPEKFSSGAHWRVQGRINQMPNARLELLDPGNTVVASTQTDTNGNFVLADTARTAGLAMYQLRILDEQKRVLETVKLPLNIVQGQALKVLSLSGGPNPELKYLRRWAIDVGVQLQSQINLSPGVQMSNASITINSASLREVDLLILDERIWATMNHNSKQAMTDALRGGMGLLLRITGPISANDRNELRTLGFVVSEADIVQAIHLDSNADKKLQPSLTRRPLRISSPDAVTWLRDDANNPLALWRAEGRGRIGLIWLTDSYKLVLTGDGISHAKIWRDAVSNLARSRSGMEIYLRDRYSRINERVVLCNISAKTSVQETDSEVAYLIPDNTGTNKNCAAYWPRRSGWHVVISDSQSLPFYVRDSNEAPGLKANAIREATQLMTAKYSPRASKDRIPVAGSSWPWFFAWLLITGLLWLLERSKLGLGAIQKFSIR